MCLNICIIESTFTMPPENVGGLSKISFYTTLSMWNMLYGSNHSEFNYKLFQEVDKILEKCISIIHLKFGYKLQSCWLDILKESKNVV